MKEIISVFLSAVKEWPWKKILVTAVSLSILVYALSLVSCGIWRKTTTYGITKTEYTMYDTIRTKSHAKIPKTYEYSE